MKSIIFAIGLSLAFLIIVDANTQNAGNWGPTTTAAHPRDAQLYNEQTLHPMNQKWPSAPDVRPADEY